MHSFRFLVNSPPHGNMMKIRARHETVCVRKNELSCTNSITLSLFSRCCWWLLSQSFLSSPLLSCLNFSSLYLFLIMNFYMTNFICLWAAVTAATTTYYIAPNLLTTLSILSTKAVPFLLASNETMMNWIRCPRAVYWSNKPVRSEGSCYGSGLYYSWLMVTAVKHCKRLRDKRTKKL